MRADAHASVGVSAHTTATASLLLPQPTPQTTLRGAANPAIHACPLQAAPTTCARACAGARSAQQILLAYLPMWRCLWHSRRAHPGRAPAGCPCQQIHTVTHSPHVHTYIHRYIPIIPTHLSKQRKPWRNVVQGMPTCGAMHAKQAGMPLGVRACDGQPADGALLRPCSGCQAGTRTHKASGPCRYAAEASRPSTPHWAPSSAGQQHAWPAWDARPCLAPSECGLALSTQKAARPGRTLPKPRCAWRAAPAAARSVVRPARPGRLQHACARLLRTRRSCMARGVQPLRRGQRVAAAAASTGCSSRLYAPSHESALQRAPTRVAQQCAAPARVPGWLGQSPAI